MLRKLLSIFLCLLVFAQPVIGLAATDQKLTVSERARLLEIFNELKNSTEIVLDDTTKSSLLVLQLKEELKASKTEIVELKKLLVKLQAEATAAQSNYDEANSLLKKASASYKAEIEQKNKDLKRLKNKVGLLEVVSTVLGVVALYEGIRH